MFFGVGRPLIPGIRKPAPDHRPSELLLHQPPVLLILCILCIDVNYEKNRFPGLAPPPHRISLHPLRLSLKRRVIPRERGRLARTLFLLRHGPAPVPDDCAILSIDAEGSRPRTPLGRR